ncbi:hypothetical protein CRUP_008330, partial [Coryphaenoides rupestris]
VKKLTKYLDPNAHGKINFKDFCHGVFAIKDNGYIYQNGEGRRAPAVVVCRRPYSEPSQYRGGGHRTDTGEWDMMDSSTENTESTDSPSDMGLEHSPSPVVILGEEQFEDYGEGEDVDLTPSSPCEDETHTTGFSDLGSSLPSSAGQTPQKIRQLYNSELLDVYCSQCCKKVNLLNDLEARLKNLKGYSQLFQANHTGFGSSQGSSTEDLFTDSIDSCDLDITEKVSFLEKKVTELESESLANGDLKSKLKQENTHLVHRVHELEEQVKDAEMRVEQSLEEQLRRHKEAFSKMQRERSTEIELLREAEDDGPAGGHQPASEGRDGSVPEDDGQAYNARTREVQHEVKRLKQENHKLRDQNDDLNAQILSLSLYEANNLFACHTKAQCLAAEIDNASRDELVDAVKEQEENNYRLRQYMDKIILAILDHNPSILEIKNE